MQAARQPRMMKHRKPGLSVETGGGGLEPRLLVGRIHLIRVEQHERDTARRPGAPAGKAAECGHVRHPLARCLDIVIPRRGPYLESGIGKPAVRFGPGACHVGRIEVVARGDHGHGLGVETTQSPMAAATACSASPPSP